MKSDTSERGLERLICTAMAGSPCEPGAGPADTVHERPAVYGAGWIGGEPGDYDREYCVDLVKLSAFLRETQPDAAAALDLGQDGPTRRKFLSRLQGEITKRGTIEVLRHGIKHGPHHLDLFYGTPSPGNAKARERYEANRFSVTRQLRYSQDETQRALDLGLFINGLPIATFELKNSLTKQTVEDAVQQYERDRDPREKLFEFGRCVVHFAVDDHEVRFCTHLKGKASWFLPFNLGWNDGAGNPPNPNGLKTDYLWKRILTRDGLTDILENYAQVVDTKDEKTGRKKAVQILPRFQQLDVVRKLLADAGRHGAGKRYLIQHSAGSGKSNSIAWLAHQFIGLTKDGAAVFDSIIVVTDRKILDQQIKDTIKQFAQVGATVGHAEHSGDLRKFIAEGKKIIISTVQKFPFILDEIGNEHRGRRFAIVIDEAHSSQGGRTAAALSMALSAAGAEEDDETTEDRINRLMEAQEAPAERQLLCLHRYAQEQDAGDLRRAGAAARRHGEASALPQLHDEAGDPGGLHPGCAAVLHARGELLQAGQEGRRRPGIRHQAGEEEAPPLRREPRPRDPTQGRDHGGPLPRAGAGPEQDRRAGAGDGGHERHRTGYPVLPRHSRLPHRAQEPAPRDRRLLRRARVRRG